MVISSRTPEGEFARCHTCRTESVVEPSEFPVRDATCPACGSRLTFAATPPDPALAADFLQSLRKKRRAKLPKTVR
jgi:DNA-directed RNA polymerase subunit RPC12/RpoP